MAWQGIFLAAGSSALGRFDSPAEKIEGFARLEKVRDLGAGGGLFFVSIHLWSFADLAAV
jgi:hypothetical protein